MRNRVNKLYTLDLSACEKLPSHFRETDPREIVVMKDPRDASRWIILIEFNDEHAYIRWKEATLAPFIQVSHKYSKLMNEPLSFAESNLPKGATIRAMSATLEPVIK